MARAVPAVRRTLDILELFLDRATLSAPEIGERLGLPRTTVHELVTTLVDRSYLVAVPDRPTRYRLGSRLFQLGGLFAEGLDLTREARAVAEQVAAECDETVHVAVLDGTEVVYVAKADSTHPVRMVSAVGRRLPAHCTAVGKALLAALPPAALDARYAGRGPLARLTPQSITSRARLRDHLAEVRARGLAYDDCESNDHVRCVAAPVRDHRGEVVAALSISVPTLRWDEERRRAWGALVLRSADRLSGLLGARPAAAAAGAATAVAVAPTEAVG
jgi:DNA-binding IclR family transcriptional regulator